MSNESILCDEKAGIVSLLFLFSVAYVKRYVDV